MADYLVSRGMPFRRAHEVVGAMVRRLLAEGRDFSDLTLEEWREASDMFGDDAPRAATALASVQARRTPQSTNPDGGARGARRVPRLAGERQRAPSRSGRAPWPI